MEKLVGGWNRVHIVGALEDYAMAKYELVSFQVFCTIYEYTKKRFLKRKRCAYLTNHVLLQ